ncbi:MAG TPA: aspartate-semialdehyde dehydrogenase [Planctomycetota bacterium]|nr:aspartate-semialdehyde dehydrogenase [Planctomycetota bacterium]HNR97914.1 aspartate-semialdehyde dehydrogenase [Planctomycetota bacterium]HNU24560.1 aspartate-semialdehyde dehydrogenase [Planctomycetota bacterium]HOE29049.1 aspartate-semialdehyde dehydrogenase [Planctomycetota bacterium]HOE85971.1 aspartate-semialdehyde dehydrogenase [Planctomycetota bacterium]
MQRINVAVIGATGMVGQNYIRLLANHPWFEVAYVAASPQSAGKPYAEAVAGRWHMPSDLPEPVRKLVVGDANDVEAARGKCALVFSAVSLEKQATAALECAYAAAGLPVVSNNSAHRFTPDVPMIIPEINPGHLDVIAAQRKARGWTTGCIVVKSNCSIQSYMTPVWALWQAGYKPRTLVVATLQALSGAGHPGVPSLDIEGNVVPLIKNEEEKTENEPLKIFGRVENGVIVKDGSIAISAHCNRVPVVDGHTACVSLKFADRAPALAEIIAIWRAFKAAPQELALPMAPERPIIYRDEPDRPQPRKDRDADKAMAVTVGRLRKCNVFDIRFAGLHHNTVRGAAGGAILTAELMRARKLI